MANNRVFYLYKKRNIRHLQGNQMKEKKNINVCLRINETQENILKAIVESGLAKNTSQAIQYLINLYGIKGGV